MDAEVGYYGGQSRDGNKAIDYMIASVDGMELYAEAETVPDDESGTYDSLKAGIIAQAKAQGIDPERLRFAYDGAEQ